MFEPELISEVPELDVLIEEGWIDDVLYELKSGKEATAWCCSGGRLSGVDLVVAKVYRPLKSRGFRNDAMYQAGRTEAWSRRERLAFESKSRLGLQMRFATWIEHEFRTLKVLHESGSSVPRPITKTSNVILMEFIGDAEGPAPLLHTVRLDPDDASRHVEQLLDDMAVWLGLDCVHGDLSAYNILVWQDRLVTIDFPQAVHPRANPNAFALLERDVANVCKHFGRYGSRLDPDSIATDLWTRYRFGEL